MTASGSKLYVVLDGVRALVAIWKLSTLPVKVAQPLPALNSKAPGVHTPAFGQKPRIWAIVQGLLTGQLVEPNALEAHHLPVSGVHVCHVLGVTAPCKGLR